MKFSVKLAVSAAMTLASAGSYAAISLPSGGDGSLTLTLFSTNDGTPFSYAFDTGLTLSQLTTAALNAPGTTLNFSLTGLAGDLSANSAATPNLVYDVTAAGQSGSIAKAGSFTLATTFDPGVSLATIAALQSGAVASAVNTNNTWLSNFGSTNPSFTTTTADANYANANYNAALNTFAVNAAAGTGNSLSFYELVSNKSTTSLIQTPTVFAGTWSINLSSDTLTYSVPGSSPVPLPPSVWLMISGLAGVAVLGRRRKGSGDLGALPA
jgi:hypothetical protein